ncbi:MAG: HAD-IA family hydrolase [Burkholderiales bacterium]
MNTLPALPNLPLALSFDLDDTLWPNLPVILRAEGVLRAWLAAHAPLTAARFAVSEMQRLRAEVGAAHPELITDLSQLRLLTIRRALVLAGEDPALAELAFEVFFEARQQVVCYAEVVAALQRLAGRFPLLALSNGNADVARVGLADYFVGSVSARSAGVAKPDARIFHAACEALKLAPAQVMHVGDDWRLDVLGARQAGLHSAWVRRPDAKAAADAAADPPAPQPGLHLTVPDLLALADALGC